MRCFKRFIYYIKYSVCPHYIIPSNNLFENRVKREGSKILLDRLYILNSYGWQCILFSYHVSKFDTLAYGFSYEARFLRVRSVEALSCSMILLAEYFVRNRNLNLKKRYYFVFSFKSSKVKSLYAYYISKLCCINDQF